jgi:hypothetical protein
VFSFSTLTAEIPSQRNKAEKEIKRIKTGKQEVKLSPFSDIPTTNWQRKKSGKPSNLQ